MVPSVVPFVLLLVVSSQASTDSEKFTRALDTMMDSVGLTKFYRNLRPITAEFSPIDGHVVLNRIATNLRGRLLSMERDIRAMRRTMERQRGPYMESRLCSAVPTMPGGGACLIPSRRHRVDVDRAERELLLTLAFIAVPQARTGLRNVFASVDDDVVLFPSNNSEQGFKPGIIHPTKTRWFRETQGAVPKDIVIVMDTSRYTNSHRTGTLPLLNLEIKAVFDTLSSLTDRDRIAVVPTTISSDTLQVSDNLVKCHGMEELVDATPVNIDRLVDFLNRHGKPQGESSLGPALRRAFRILKVGTDQKESAKRAAVLVVLLASNPPENETQLMGIMSEEMDALGRSVVTVTAFVGQTRNFEATVDLLHHLAICDTGNHSATDVARGRTINIDRQGTEYLLGRTIHDIFSRHVRAAQIVTYGTTQLDDFGTEVVSYACLPVHRPQLAGVICHVIRIQDLLTNMVVPELTKTYFILVDGGGKLLLHSLVPLPDKDNPQEYTIDFKDVERTQKAAEVLASMLRGEGGETSFVKNNDLDDSCPGSFRVIYNWMPVSGTNLSLCVVNEYGSTQVTRLSDVTQPKEVLYHRMDLDTLGRNHHPTCIYHGFEAYPDFSIVKLTAAAYKHPSLYPGYKDNEYSVKSLTFYLGGQDQWNPGIKEISRKFVALGLFLEQIWRDTFDIRKNVYLPKWVSIGFTNGVFISYPGTRLSDSYDHTTRPWYQAALRHRGKVVIVRPYKDAETDDVVITISQSVSIERNIRSRCQDGVTFGVLAGDFNIPHFQYIIRQSFKDCEQEHLYRCMAVDDKGFLIFHPDFLDSKKTTIDVHIIEKEPLIAEALIKHEIMVAQTCSHVALHKIHKGWKLMRESAYDESNHFYAIAGSNIHVLRVRTIQPPGISPCTCQQSPVDCLSSCECPCLLSDPLDRCNNMSDSLPPLCVYPRPPPDDTHDTVVNHVNTSEFHTCNPGCRYVSNEEYCRSRGCKWCPARNDGEGHTLSRGSCGVYEECGQRPFTRLPLPPTTKEPMKPIPGGGGSNGGTSLTLVTTAALGGIIFVLICVGAAYIYLQKKRRTINTPEPTNDDPVDPVDPVDPPAPRSVTMHQGIRTIAAGWIEV